MNTFQFEWVCPHCGHKNQEFTEMYKTGMCTKKLTYCDVDEGGCDAMVIIHPQITYTVKVFKTEEVK